MPERGVREAGIPPRLGRYEVLGLLATGGMAEILLGKLLGPAGFERAVVIKRVLPHLAREQEFRTMFLDEARTVAGIRNPNVVQVHELGRDGDELFLVMEYVEGESVSNLAKTLRKAETILPTALAAHVVAEACAGLHAAHELHDEDGQPLDIVHRDVSPQNIMVTYGGAVKVLDFGIAKASSRATRTESGMMKGKFAYMAPEQCRGERVDRRADVFALGIVLHELSTGTKLFSRATEMAVLRAVCDDAIPRPGALVDGYPQALEEVVFRALAREPGARYSTAAEMRRDLIAVARDLDPHGIPQEQLSSLMHDRFEQRKVQKQELLRRVRSGSTLTRIPEANLDTATRRHGSQPPTLTAPALTGKERRPTRAHVRGILAGATLLCLGAAGAWIAMGHSSSGVAPDPPVVAPPAEPEAPQPEGPSLEEPEPPSPVSTADPGEIRIRIETRPAGATVRVDGRELGNTPTAVELPRGSGSVVLELSRRGYRTHREELTPDVDQRLDVALRRARRPGGAGPSMEPAPAMMGMDAPDDFFRFE